MLFSGKYVFLRKVSARIFWYDQNNNKVGFNIYIFCKYAYQPFGGYEEIINIVNVLTKVGRKFFNRRMVLKYVVKFQI